MENMKKSTVVYVVTYNVHNKPPPEDFTRLLKLDAIFLPNLYAIGLQEVDAGPNALLSSSVYDDPWTRALTDSLCKKKYVRVKTVRLLGIQLVVFVRRIDLPYITNIESEYTRGGFGGLWGNKGGVSIRLDVSGVNMCFVNCHLQPHIENVSDRIQQYDWIVESQKFRNKASKTVLDHDYVFWFGDLNFRIDELTKQEIENRIESGDIKYLEQFDQLQRAVKDELLLVDFEEGPLRFLPTYKYDPDTDRYDTSKKQRKPAWTDRILWLVHEDSFQGLELSVRQESYLALQDYKFSDHRPVISEFEIQVLRYPPELPVMFDAMPQWLSTQSQNVCYSIAHEYTVSAHDWIGLYKADYRHPLDYVTYQWAETDGEDNEDQTNLYNIKFDKYYLKPLVGLHCLCYFSYYQNCIIGYSDTFKVSLTEDEDSSDAFDNDNQQDSDSSSDSDHLMDTAAIVRPKTAKTRRR